MTAVEENAGSVADGEASRRLNRIAETQCRFVRARAEELAEGRHRRALGDAPDAVVMDPPRTGCTPSVLGWVAERVQPRTITYVSCNPEALAGDARSLLDSGYRLASVQPVDMFPHTLHIEAVAIFERVR